MEEGMVDTVQATTEDMEDIMEDIMVRDLLSLDMAMVVTLDPMVDMDIEEDMGEVTVPMGEAIAAMEVTMERERLDMVVMEVPMVVVMVEVMEEVMVEAIL